jgi:hypothetical protein
MLGFLLACWATAASFSQPRSDALQQGASDDDAASAAATGGALPTLFALAADATPIERLAATELARILLLVAAGNRSSQRTVSPAAAAGQPHFAVGYGASVAAGMTPRALATLGEDSFAISTAANLSRAVAPVGSVALSGCAHSPRGSLFAVYELIRALGVKILGEDAIILPSTGRIASMPQLEIVFVPSFEMRGIGSWANMNSAMWSASLGCVSTFSHCTHNFTAAVNWPSHYVWDASLRSAVLLNHLRSTG